MLLVAEALFVALYSLVLFRLINFTGLNVSTCVFITGFLKHFSVNYFGTNNSIKKIINFLK
jgi:hypothetical protein